MRLSLGFSSCPNDTFVFDAMVHGKVDTEGLAFEVIIADVEDLNNKAFASIPDITKISYHAFPFIAGKYVLLTAGSALGRGNGPLLISHKNYSLDKIPYLRIAIPGKMTTANLLFSIYFPKASGKTEYLFSEIENAILSDEVDAGVIIHESRFTYEKKGLIKIADLGKNWEESTGLPIPLGGIVAKRNLGYELLYKIERILKRSIEFALTYPDSSREFVKFYAQEIDDEIINQHIGLYVNHFTIDLNTDGRRAVRSLFDKARRCGLIPELPDEIFLPANEN